MPEARDRLARREDLIEVYRRQRRLAGSIRGGAIGSGFEILAGEPEEVMAARTPVRLGRAAVMGTRVAMGLAASGGGRNLYRSPVTGSGIENLSPGSGGGRGRRRRSVLPSWYPMTPLRDITAIMRAIERRRARVRQDGGGLNAGSPDPSVSTSGALLDHDSDSPFISPRPTKTGVKKPHEVPVSEVPKLFLDITSEVKEDSGFLTPQKKLLSSIDTVEKAVMEELHKLKRAPTAKKAEREKRMRTLMSMR